MEWLEPTSVISALRDESEEPTNQLLPEKKTQPVAAIQQVRLVLPANRSLKGKCR